MHLLTLIFNFSVLPSVETDNRTCHQKSNQIMHKSARTTALFKQTYKSLHNAVSQCNRFNSIHCLYRHWHCEMTPEVAFLFSFVRRYSHIFKFESNISIALYSSLWDHQKLTPVSHLTDVLKMWANNLLIKDSRSSQCISPLKESFSSSVCFSHSL